MYLSVSRVADVSMFTQSSSMVTATVEFPNQERSLVLAEFIGVLAALIFGPANFTGGVAAKRISAVLVTTANALPVRGLRLGEITIQSVLTALCSAGTILLAVGWPPPC